MFSLKKIEPKQFFLILFILIFALAIRLYGLSAAGTSWDEHFYYDAAFKFAQNIKVRDFRAISWDTNQEHPSVGKYFYLPAVAVNKYFKSPHRFAYNTARFFSVIYSVITVLLVYQIGRRFFSETVGFLAAIILAALPNFLAYSKIIVLDIPQTLLFTAAVYLFLLALEAKKNHLFFWSVILGSLAFATKYNGILILVLFAIIFLIYHWDQFKKDKTLTLPIILILSPIIFISVLIFVWPWLWQDTLGHLSQSLGHWGGKVQEEFLGQTRDGPIYYFLLYFLVTTPALLFAPFLYWVYKTVKSPKNLNLSILFWFLVPFLISLFHLRQDGTRYVLTAFPAFALGAALGIEGWRTQIKNISGYLIILIVPLYLGVTLSFTYPYFLDYYNELVGFTKNVEKKHLFMVGFYGQGIREALDYLEKIAPNNAKVKIILTPDRDVVFYDKRDSQIILRGKFIRTLGDDYDYLIIYRVAPEEEKNKVDYQKINLIHTVKVLGAPIVRIYQKN